MWEFSHGTQCVNTVMFTAFGIDISAMSCNLCCRILAAQSTNHVQAVESVWPFSLGCLPCINTNHQFWLRFCTCLMCMQLQKYLNLTVGMPERLGGGHGAEWVS